MKSAPKPRTPMTDLERRAAKCLGACSICPATATKRFARDMAALAGTADAALTDGQRRFLWGAVHRFRRQITDRDVLIMAEAYKDLPV